MGPLLAAVGNAAPMATHRSFLEYYEGLEMAELVVVHGVATVLVATVVLGLLPLYGTQAVKHARRWTISSTLIGLPITGALVAGLWLGLILSESGLGFVIGVPMVIAATIFLPSWASIGFVVLGETVAVRLGVDRLWVAVLIGGVVGALVPLQPLVGGAVLVVLTSLGVGAGARTLFKYMFSGLTEERVRPPSEKV